MQNLTQGDFKEKTVFVRVDYNVPLDEKGNIISFNRINSTFKTIDFLLEKNAKIILCSHLGRPKGEKKAEYSLKPVYNYLKLKYPNILWGEDVVGDKIEEVKQQMKSGDILLLENVRFIKGEEENDENVVKELSKGVDCFVDEAFAVSHRSGASNFGIAQVLSSFIGFNYQREIQNLSLKNKENPKLAIIGGAKIADKIKLLKSLLNKVDALYIGGAIASTFLLSQGYEMGKSVVDKEQLNTAKEITNMAKEKGVKLVLPKDLIIADELATNQKTQCVKINQVPKDKMALDIGKESIKELKKMIKNYKTIFWNGTLGYNTIKEFENGTKSIVLALAKCKSFTIIGGGDTVGEVEKLNKQEKISFVSTGGGASLNFIQNEVY